MSPLVLFVALLSVSAQVYGWWDTGHMLVAQIAMQHLMADSSNVSLAAQSALTNAIYAMPTYSNKSDTIVSSACWMDDIKARNFAQFSNWHFINLPVCMFTNQTRCADIPTTKEVFDEENNYDVVWAIQQGLATLKGKQAMGFERGFAVRTLLHLVGDLHQPLHAAEGYYDQQPNGDAGGNGFRITNVGFTTNLHGLWDSACGLYNVTVPRPLTEDGEQFLSQQANWIINNTVFTPNVTDSTNVTFWAVESQQIAATVVYNLTYNTQPSEDYIQTCQNVAVQQIGTAGLRLALLLKQIAACNDNNCPANPNPNGDVSSDNHSYVVAIAVLASFLGVVTLFLVLILFFQNRKSREIATAQEKTPLRY